SVVVHAQQVSVGDRARPVHFELEKIFSINVLRSLQAVQNRHANLAIEVWFHIGNVQSVSDFFGHVVAPAVTRCSRDERSSQDGTSAEKTGGGTKLFHYLKSHAHAACSRSGDGRSSRAQTMFGCEASGVRF